MIWTCISLTSLFILLKFSVLKNDFNGAHFCSYSCNNRCMDPNVILRHRLTQKRFSLRGNWQRWTQHNTQQSIKSKAGWVLSRLWWKFDSCVLWYSITNVMASIAKYSQFPVVRHILIRHFLICGSFDCSQQLFTTCFGQAWPLRNGYPG